jgi:DNA gyrase subunit A
MDNENQENKTDKILDVEIVETMKSSYIDYAMSVIVARALPDVRDGLKPVHRRILYAMNELGLDTSKPHKKSAKIVGDTMGKYHPHGDAAIYDALVRMAQNFSMRYPLVDGHGNFGNVDGYPAAAQRYTEARLAGISTVMLADIGKDTVDFIDNYDGEEKEPVVLPSKMPNLLVNGSTGIAVGMATNIPPHNLGEVVGALIRIIDNKIEDKDTELEEVMEFIKGPDFPTGATILGKSGITAAYRTGRGKVTIRSTADIETQANGKERIIITELPYQVNKKRLIEKMAELVKDKKVEGISDIRDETDKDYGIRVVVECKKDASANVILNQLYKYTQLQESYGINFLAIVNNAPKVLSLMEMLGHYLDHQKNVITRRTQYDLNKALDRSHIIEGLLIALDHIDEVIRIIRASKTTNDAKAALMENFDLSERQVTAIVEMRLRALTGLEREKLENEYAELRALIEKLQAILSDEKKLYNVIKEELKEVAAKYNDDRRTHIVYDEGEINIEDLIEDEMSVITMTNLNYVKRIPLDTYKSQNRGGKGIKGMETREEDFVKSLFISSNHTSILYFTNKGKVYTKKTYEIPEAGRTAKGTPIVNLIQLENGEDITAVIPFDNFSDTDYLVMITKQGIIKKTQVSMFANIRKMGLRAVNLKEDDELICVCRTDGNKDLFVATKNGKSIRFSESDLRPMGRTATGVKAMTVGENDEAVAAGVIEDGFKILIVTENGYGKCSEVSEYRKQARGGKGTKTYNITEKTGKVTNVQMVNDNEQLIMVTNEGIIIRIRVSDIATTGRVAQGVKLINRGSDDIKVVSVAKIDEASIEKENSEENSEDE